MSSQERARAALEPVVAEAVAGAGFELESLDVRQAGRKRVVKIVVDNDAGIGLDEVAEASRAISAALDSDDTVDGPNDAFGGPYTLEVTSPGVDRPLTKPRHWRRARSRLVAVKGTDGTSFTGRVGRVDDDPAGGVRMLVDGSVRTVRYDSVEHAVVEVEFKQAPDEELALLREDSDTEEGSG
ncbi:ribosome maturation factor RimP [Herbihabitans rhizosphaerae]|uniref:Ribosome maturation factor RimP n=1 Tax=Herbihabitans rhizosphaerae TaxID=1872711 RepID=A0A4Q7KCC5_9PSEU|nr:ribosome maturation factor RimP [Herbihabitans rhizosphaerae]RZS30484.1 ribosome maturation factor RimP [Herbihabitans rhizosphaerae]